MGCCVINKVTNHFMYADDLVLIAPSVKGLQTIVDICYEFGVSHSIQFNSIKSQCMLFRTSNIKWGIMNPVVYLGNNELMFVRKYKYLGHVRDDNLKDDTDMHIQAGKLYARGNMLLRKFYLISDEAKILLFKSFCSNVYCCSLWCSYNASFLDKVRVAYNNSFRILLKLPKYCSASNMFVERRVPSFGEMLRKCRNSLHSRLRKSENTIVRVVLFDK